MVRYGQCFKSLESGYVAGSDSNRQPTAALQACVRKMLQHTKGLSHAASRGPGITDGGPGPAPATLRGGMYDANAGPSQDGLKPV